MKENLIIVKERQIAFSRHYGKHNGMPTIIGWDDFMIAPGRLSLPIGRSGFFLLRSNKKDEQDDKVSSETVKPGPVTILIHRNGKVVEHYAEEEQKTHVIPTSQGSFYTRSRGWDLESAATVANLVYPDIADIYRAAIKALGGTPFPFYVGDVKDIGKALMLLEEFNVKADKYMKRIPKDGKPINKKHKEEFIIFRDEWTEVIDNFHKHAKLTLHPC